MKFCVVFVTAPKGKEAARLSRLILRKKLAACVNIVGPVESFFRWGGKVERARESLMVIKTRRSLLTDVIGTIKKAHSYSVCEVIALPIIAGNKPYLDWINASCAKDKL